MTRGSGEGREGRGVLERFTLRHFDRRKAGHVANDEIHQHVFARLTALYNLDVGRPKDKKTKRIIHNSFG